MLKNPLRRVGTLLDAGALQPSRSARNHWTKFRTVPGWVIGVLVTIAVITAFTFLATHVSGERRRAPGRLPGPADRARR